MEFRGLDHVIIVGSGFSKYAGLPLTSEFTKNILSSPDSQEGPTTALVDYLIDFTKEIFCWKTPPNPQDWPELEDIFTCIDLAANSGHNLSSSYPPARLRTVRRVLIARIMRMLFNRYKKAWQAKGKQWRLLAHFLQRVDLQRSAFISLNWDTVIESRLLTTYQDLVLDYGCGETAAIAPAGSGRPHVPSRPSGPVARIVKIHGSLNWMYCDNCRSLFWFHPFKVNKIADQLLSDKEWDEVWPNCAPKRNVYRWLCARCACALGTRLATFSYRKALNFPMFQQSWYSAELLLRNARRWTFIGYSMPAADYELKFLLKRIQVSLKHPPQIILVTGGEQAERTLENYRRFFGECMESETSYFLDGIESDDMIDFLVAPGKESI